MSTTKWRGGLLQKLISGWLSPVDHSFSYGLLLSLRNNAASLLGNPPKKWAARARVGMGGNSSLERHWPYNNSSMPLTTTSKSVVIRLSQPHTLCVTAAAAANARNAGATAQHTTPVWQGRQEVYNTDYYCPQESINTRHVSPSFIKISRLMRWIVGTQSKQE